MKRDEFYAAVDDYKKDHIKHHGILGMKWGIRRYQNPDGSLTDEGRKRLGKFNAKKEKAIEEGNVKFAFKYRRRFTDDDFKRLERVINEKTKYSDLMSRANRARMDRIRNYTDILNLSLNTANNVMGLTNNVMNLTSKIGNKNNDTFEQTVIGPDGNPISYTKKYTDSKGIKRSDTYKYK